MRLVALCWLALGCILARAANPKLLDKTWSAQWIALADAPQHDYGVYHFRHTFTLPVKPERFLVHVSADNRYILYVNGTLMSEGPARGDLFHWRYESLDIAPHLNAGRNTVAAVVWNEGSFAGLAQISNQTAFLLQGDSDAEAAINTGAAWKAIRDTAYTANPIAEDQKTGYHALGPAEHFDAHLYPWGWEQPTFADTAWSAVRVLTAGEPRGSRDPRNRWMLVANALPQQERKPFPAPRIRKGGTAAGFGTIGAHTKAQFLLDQEELVTGFPRFRFSGGKGAKIGIRYAEGLWASLNPRSKGDRNEVEGKRFLGYQDVYLADGADNRTYEPLAWRTWRYIEVTVETAATPLRIDEVNATFSAYPFEQKWKFSSAPDRSQHDHGRRLADGPPVRA